MRLAGAARRQRGRCLGAVLTLVVVAAGAEAQQPADTAAVLRLQVVDRESQAPLGFAIITSASLGVDRFTSDRGAITIAGAPPGEHRVRVRLIGYAPLDTTVSVAAGSAHDVRLPLSRVAVQLSEVRVVALRRCTNPGPPRGSDAAQFAAIFDQLRQNAERYDLLTRQYPFSYRIERRFGVMWRDSTERQEAPDTVLISGSPEWRYAPGRLVIEERENGKREHVVHLPTLVDFADSTFQHAHCFAFAGFDTLAGREVVRIDFLAADTLRAPDADGSIFLDAQTYQIRGMRLELTRVPRQVRGVTGIRIRATFDEVLPSTPILTRVRGVNSMRARRPSRVIATTEEQRLLNVVFLRGLPGG